MIQGIKNIKALSNAYGNLTSSKGIKLIKDAVISDVKAFVKANQ